ncbi:hypothetical protein BC830DRAFT_1097441 [Chytriomyces sp. MP71]|nr:hypothetical protein BC830DRAFT_1097441 [Chytriomyces sp. MP71]
MREASKPAAVLGARKDRDERGVAMARSAAQRRDSTPSAASARATTSLGSLPSLMTSSALLASAAASSSSVAFSSLASLASLPGPTQRLDKAATPTTRSPIHKVNLRKRSISFKESVRFHETFSRDEYDRSSRPRAELSFRDLAELTTFKMQLACNASKASSL